MVYFAVGCGGVLGSILRFLFDQLFSRTFLPLSSGILIVNLLGCFTIGLFLSLNSKRFSSLFKIAFSTGFLGSFTTFSSFSMKALDLFMEWGLRTSAIYISITIIGGFCSVQLGQSIAMKIEKSSL